MRVVHLLLVEDDPGDARLVQGLLRGARDLDVHVEDRLERAVGHLGAHEVDLVLLDLGLPDSRGIETVRAVRRQAPHVPIVVLTGHDDEETGEAAIREGAEDYVTKGQVASVVLVRAIRYALERHEHLRRAEHLAKVLRAIRGVNRLAASEAEPERLIEQACDLLVREHGFPAVWIALARESGAPWAIAQAGWGEAFEPLACRFAAGEWLACRDAAIASGRVLTSAQIASVCQACPLHRSGEMLSALRHGEKVYGLIGLSGATGIAMDSDECDLVGQVAGDVALALHGSALERSRRRSEAQFRLVTETIRDVFWMRTPDLSRVVHVSPGYEKLWGEPCDRLLRAPRSFLERVHPDDRARLETVLAEKHARGIEYEVEYRIVRADGSLRWVDERSYPVSDPTGAIPLSAGVCTDVTERKGSEAALQASQERLKRILATAGEGIWVFDGEGRTTLANPRAGEFFAFDPEAAAGRRVDELARTALTGVAPEDVEALRRGTIGRRELTVPAGRDGQRHLHVSAAQLFDPAGRPDGAVAVFTDMTDHVRARQQLVHAQRMEAVGRLASGVAHDFNNVLAVVLSSAGFILESLPEGDPRLEDARAILDAGGRAALLVRQLLTFARKGLASPVPIDLNEVVKGMESLLRRTLGEDVQIELSLEPGLSTTRMDAGHAEQVLMNLSVNARDAMPGGGKLRIATRTEDVPAPPAECPELAPGRYVVLEVSDTGLGMQPAVLARVFEPFFTTKQAGKGTGLGLPTVLGIVKEAGGQVSLLTRPREGTTFRIYLPPCARPPPERREPAQPVRAAGHGERVLVVEDDDSVRASVCRMLGRSGFVPLAVRNGSDACRLIREGQVLDAVLSDVVMPGLSGREIQAAVDRLRPGLPFVFMSGYEDLAAAPPGAGPVLTKPFTEDALASRLLDALARGRGTRR